MKRLYFAALFLIALTPYQALAHGSVSNQAGNAVVFLTQQPLSPLVGEEVRMTFSVRNKELRAIPQTDVVLKLVKTGDEPSQDEIVLTETKTSDVNGSFDFYYKFPEEDYYDVELSLQDPITSESIAVGFLVQTRNSTQSFFDQYKYWIIGIVLADCFIVIMLLQRQKTGYNN